MLRAPHSAHHSTSPTGGGRGRGAKGAGGYTASSRNSFSTLKNHLRCNCHFTGVIAGAHGPDGAEKLHQSDLPLREGASSPRWRLLLAPWSAAVSSSSGSSSYFLWFPFPHFTHQEIKQYDNGFNVSKLKPFNPLTSKFTSFSTIHLLKPPSVRTPHLHPPPSSILPLFSLSDSSKILHQLLSVPSFLCPSIHMNCFL